MVLENMFTIFSELYYECKYEKNQVKERFNFDLEYSYRELNTKIYLTNIKLMLVEFMKILKVNLKLFRILLDA